MVFLHVATHLGHGISESVVHFLIKFQSDLNLMHINLNELCLIYLVQIGVTNRLKYIYRLRMKLRISYAPFEKSLIFFLQHEKYI